MSYKLKILFKAGVELFFVLLLIASCTSTETETSYTIGTVKYLSFEGGFYGIVTDDKKNLDPLNLSKEFQVDSKRIMFKYEEKKDMASFHMWGIIVQILEIRELK